jgi:hypothetical protein
VEVVAESSPLAKTLARSYAPRRHAPVRGGGTL